MGGPSINNFTAKLLSKLLSKLPSDLYIGVHLKGTKKFGSKAINQYKTIFCIERLCFI